MTEYGIVQKTAEGVQFTPDELCLPLQQACIDSFAFWGVIGLLLFGGYLLVCVVFRFRYALLLSYLVSRMTRRDKDGSD